MRRAKRCLRDSAVTHVNLPSLLSCPWGMGGAEGSQLHSAPGLWKTLRQVPRDLPLLSGVAAWRENASMRMEITLDEVGVGDVGVESSDVGCLDVEGLVGGDGGCAGTVEVLEDVDVLEGVLHAHGTSRFGGGGDGSMCRAEDGVEEGLDRAQGIAEDDVEGLVDTAIC